MDRVSRVVCDELLVLFEIECVGRSLAKHFADYQWELAAWLCIA